MVSKKGTCTLYWDSDLVPGRYAVASDEGALELGATEESIPDLGVQGSISPELFTHIALLPTSRENNNIKDRNAFYPNRVSPKC